MEHIPFLGWVCIGAIAVFILVINISLVILLLAKKPLRPPADQPRPPGFVGAAQDLAKMGKVLRDPFAKERGQLDELSQLVQGLNEPSPPEDTNKQTEI